MPFRSIVTLVLIALVTSGCSIIDLMSGKMPTVSPGVRRLSVGDFEIIDPYAVPGFWAKVQLHVHTDRSIDGRWPVSAALEAYARRGYDFVAITDHDTITAPATVPAGLTVIKGEEHTLSNPFYPLGQHVVFLFVERRVNGTSVEHKFRDVVAQEGLAVIAHPTWSGYGGYGEWQRWQLNAVPSFQMMEVYNPYSNSDRDTALWHEIVWQRGPYDPVWAVAVDDAHDASGVDRGWTMAKVDGKEPRHLKEALIRGSHYATTGIIADFGVDDNGAIWARSSESAEIVFINAENRRVLTVRNAREGRYQPVGTEGFIRIEIRGSSGKRAWSQPFWIIEKASG